MIRRLTLAAALLFVSSVPARAQARPASHPVAHAALDSAHHAAIHALLAGNWHGTLSALHGDSSGFDLSIVHDSLHKLVIAMGTDHGAMGTDHGAMGAAYAMHPGAPRDFAIDGDKVSWTQDVSGSPCRVTAVLSAGTAPTPGALKGKMTCDNREMAFTLQKKND